MYMRERFQTFQQHIPRRAPRDECNVILLEAIGAHGLKASAVTGPEDRYVLTTSNRGVEPNPFKIAVPLTDGPALC